MLCQRWNFGQWCVKDRRPMLCFCQQKTSRVHYDLHWSPSMQIDSRSARVMVKDGYATRKAIAAHWKKRISHCRGGQARDSYSVPQHRNLKSRIHLIRRIKIQLLRSHLCRHALILLSNTGRAGEVSLKIQQAPTRRAHASAF